MPPFELHVEHDLSALKGFRRTLDEWLEHRGLLDPPRAAVVLATHEALANAIEHSNSPVPVLVKADARDDGVMIEITDNGEWRIREPELNGEGGRGIALMRSLVSDVQITSEEQGTTVRLFQRN
jgi:anti-sigma regulatory factor (Ser/Thr protein kinase)